MHCVGHHLVHMGCCYDGVLFLKVNPMCKIHLPIWHIFYNMMTMQVVDES